MSTLGELLRSAREKRGFSVEDVAARTKIRSNYIEKLENNSLEELPQEVFIKGFLRNLSRLYGLNADEVLVLFQELLKPVVEEGQTVSSNQEDPKPEPKQKKKMKPKPMPLKRQHGSVKQDQMKAPRRALAAVLLLLVLAAAVYFGATWLGAGEETPEEFIPMEQDAETDIPEPVLEPEPVVEEESSVDVFKEFEYKYITPVFIEDGLDIMLQISKEVDSQCWISVSVDEGEEYSTTLKAGDVARFFGKELVQLTLGDAGVVSIFQDGVDTGFKGESGQVLYKDFLKE